ncbi:T6SS immunity protein Tli4 family protein [Massilia endophytica]|uniref:T6SS immunity protein Tli4 family protein n=1 Tax=Massilia endophytica TaxID=2899220 RepID=UPI001E29034D|nr:T6SS immunity protein Tli4 family protein [Massilia endophytica]UGQ46149.1 hypothetical protein LSQ66_20635 [Massilia endophytica]
MNTHLLRGNAAAIAVVCVLAIPLIVHSTAKAASPSPSDRVSVLFKKMRTVCAGRFLLDVPESATVIFGRADTPYQTYRLEGDGNNADKIIDEYLKALEKERYRVSNELLEPESLLGKVIDGPVPGQRILFDLSAAAGDEYHIKSFTRVGNDLFLQSANVFADRAYYSKHLSQINEAAARLRPRDNNSVPTESGFCIDGALVHDAEHYLVERVQLGVRLAEFPDVHFSLEMVRKSRKIESDALEPRLREAERDAIQMGMGAWYAKIKTLRRGERILKPWSGYEVLAHLPPQKHEGESHHFNFVALGEPKNAYIPTIDMDLNTGVKNNRPGAVTPSVTDDEAVYIWDRLTNSLRVRPVTTPAK